MQLATTLLSVALLLQHISATPTQQILLLNPDLAQIQTGDAQAAKGTVRPLKGRFLHVTDFHPDPFYKTYSSTEKEAACHRGHGAAGLYGAETAGCDSPISLVNETFRWIDENIKGTIDFVVWTGDSARHDNDEDIPRSGKQIEDLNKLLVTKFNEVFAKPDKDDDTDPTNDFTIPIIPSIGNNDIVPHNIFSAGPNRWTREFASIWRQFIPEEQTHQFERGGWFSVEAIPNKLAVFSLNTMYWFDSNAATDGCAARSEPGYEQFEWLRVQLDSLRQRGMKAILIGHVPPARTSGKMSWDETCWQKYTLWKRQYRDVIAGALYGHMNIDHFMLEDFDEIKMNIIEGLEEPEIKRVSMLDESLISIQAAADYITDLRSNWARLPKRPKESKTGKAELVIDNNGNTSRKQRYLQKIGGRWAERFSASIVGPSILPTYFPTMRIYHYNITGVDSKSGTLKPSESQPSYIGNRKAALRDLLDDAGKALNSIVKSATDIVGLARFTQSPTPGVSMDKDRENAHLELADRTNSANNDPEGTKKGRKKKKKPKRPRFTVPDSPSKSAPPGPAYSPQTLTLLGYTQYYANLTRINGDLDEIGQVADTSASHLPSVVLAGHGGNASSEGLSSSPDAQGDDLSAIQWKIGIHHGQKPYLKRPRPEPEPFEYEIEYDTRDDKHGYGLKDLTVKNYVRLAQRIGHFRGRDPPDFLDDDDDFRDVEDQGKSHEEEGKQNEEDYGSGKKRKKYGKGRNKEKRINRFWFTFVQRAFVGTLDDKSIREQFGTRSPEGVYAEGD